MTYLRVIVASLGAVLAVCGGQTIPSASGSDGSARASTAVTVVGAVAGMEVPTTDTIARVQPLVGTFGPFTRNGVVVEISNVAGLCELAQTQSRASPPNSTWLKVIVASPAPVVAGTYAITDGNATFDPTSTLGVLTLATVDPGGAGCSASKTYDAASGSIVLTTVTPTTVEGTFSVTMESGERLSGSFSAPVCDAPSGKRVFICGV